MWVSLKQANYNPIQQAWPSVDARWRALNNQRILPPLGILFLGVSVPGRGKRQSDIHQGPGVPPMRTHPLLSLLLYASTPAFAHSNPAYRQAGAQAGGPAGGLISSRGGPVAPRKPSL